MIEEIVIEQSYKIFKNQEVCFKEPIISNKKDLKEEPNGTQFSYKENIFIYGDNGTGKSTLTDFLKSYNSNSSTNTNLNISWKEGYEKNIKVFNKKYINENLGTFFEDGKTNEIVTILGQENKELKEKQNKIKLDIKNLEENLTNYRKTKETSKKELRDFFKEVAQERKKISSNYIAESYNTIEKDFDFHNTNINLLSDEEIFEKINIIKQLKSDKKEILFHYNYSSYEHIKLIEEANEILQKSVVSNAIENLQKNKVLSDWVKTGLEYHKNKNICLYCDNTISNERKQSLEKHFSNEWKQYRKELENIKQRITTKEKTIEYNLGEYEKYINDITDSGIINIEKNKIDQSKRFINNNLSELKTLFTTLEEKKDFEKEQKYTSQISKNNNFFNEYKVIIDEYNQKIKQSKSEINKLEEELKNNILCKNYKKYKDRKNNIEKEEKKIKNLENVINEKNEELDIMVNKLKGSSEFCKEINRVLSQDLGRLELSLSVSSNEEGYTLKRNENVAKNLSEGEKNTLALIYFLLSLEDTSTNLENTVIVIDDPVSSMDKIFSHMAYKYICEKTKKACQRIILTHNIDFYRLFISSFKNNTDGFFIIQSDFDKKTVKRYSKIEKLSNKNLKEKFSYYTYLFKVLYDVRNSLEEYSPLLNIATLNICRQLLEGFIQFKTPDKNLNSSLDEKKETLLRRFPHTGSHYQGDYIEGQKDIVKETLEFIEKKDDEHYKGMINLVKDKK